MKVYCLDLFHKNSGDIGYLQHDEHLAIMTFGKANTPSLLKNFVFCEGVLFRSFS